MKKAKCSDPVKKQSRRECKPERAPYVPLVTPEPRVPVIPTVPVSPWLPCYPIPSLIYPRVTSYPVFPNPACMCGKPLLLYIPPGQCAHPCPVHPEYTIWGSYAWCTTNNVIGSTVIW